MADVAVRSTETGELLHVPEETVQGLIDEGLVELEGTGGDGGPGGAVHRFLESAASEGSFGLSDVARRRLGITGSTLMAGIMPAAAPMAAADLLQGSDEYSGEAIDAAQQERAVEHPVADIAGRVGMGLGQAVATGGVGRGVGGLLALATPTGLAEAGGHVASNFVRRALPGRAGRIGAAIGRWGVEGTIGGAEGAVIDSLAYDTPLTAESVMSSMGWGAGAGLGLGLLGTAASRGIRGMRARRIANGSMGQGPADIGILGRAQQIFGGVDEAHIRGGQDPEVRRRATTPEPELEDLASVNASVLDDISESREAIRRSIDANVEGLRSRLSGVDPDLAQASALEFLNEGVSSIQRLIHTQPPMKSLRDLTGLRDSLSRAAVRISGTWDPTTFSRIDPEVTAAADIFAELENLRRELGPLAAPGAIDSPAAAALIQDVYHALQGKIRPEDRVWQPGLLTNSEIWGEAGAIKARYTQATDELMNFEEALRPLQEKTSREGERAHHRFTTPRLRSGLDRMGSQKGENLQATLEEWLQRQENLARIYADDYGVEAGNDLFAKIGEYRPRLNDTLQTFQARNLFTRGTAAEQSARGFGAAAGIGGTALAGGILGYGITGDPVSAIPIALSFAALTRPMLYYRFLASRDRMLGQFQRRFTGAMDTFRNQMRRVSRSTKGKSFIAPLVAPMMIGNSREQRIEEYDNRVQELRYLQTNPQALIDNLGDSFSDAAHFDPRLAAYLHEASLRGMQWLTMHMPLAEQNPLAPHLPRRPASDTERDAFLTVFRAVEDPLSVIEDLARLRVHPLSVATLRNVYPEIFALAQSEIVYELGELEVDPPYQVKVNLGTMLQYPVDASLAPDFIQMLQSRSAQTTEQSQTVGLSRSGARGEMSSRTMTETTRLLSPE